MYRARLHSSSPWQPRRDCRSPAGAASPKSTADAVGQLYAEVLYKVGHAIDDTEEGQTESGCLISTHGYLLQGRKDMVIVVFCIAGQSTAADQA
jgi:hypothetical protein